MICVLDPWGSSFFSCLTFVTPHWFLILETNSSHGQNTFSIFSWVSGSWLWHDLRGLLVGHIVTLLIPSEWITFGASSALISHSHGGGYCWTCTWLETVTLLPGVRTWATRLHLTIYVWSGWYRPLTLVTLKPLISLQINLFF